MSYNLRRVLSLLYQPLCNFNLQKKHVVVRLHKNISQRLLPIPCPLLTHHWSLSWAGESISHPVSLRYICILCHLRLGLQSSGFLIKFGLCFSSLPGMTILSSSSSCGSKGVGPLVGRSALTDPEVSVVVLVASFFLLVCTCCQCGHSGYMLCPVSLVFLYFVKNWGLCYFLCNVCICSMICPYVCCTFSLVFHLCCCYSSCTLCFSSPLPLPYNRVGRDSVLCNFCGFLGFLFKHIVCNACYFV